MEINQLALFEQTENKQHTNTEQPLTERDPCEPLPGCISIDCDGYRNKCGCGYLWCEPPLRCPILVRAGLA